VLAATALDKKTNQLTAKRRQLIADKLGEEGQVGSRAAAKVLLQLHAPTPIQKLPTNNL
jgi:hypothetical protein